MRWFVEISSLGTGGEGPSKLCVEAPQWQPALQKARAMRGDDGSLGNFSIELLDDGYRAIDPGKRLRYVVRKAPNDAPLSPVPDKLSASLPPSVPTPAQAEPPKRPLAQTAAYGSTGAAAVRQEAESLAQQKEKPAPAPRPASISTAAAVAVSLPTAPAIPRPVTTASAPAPRPASVPPAASVPIPSYRVLTSREQSPTDSSPLTYRELVYVVPETTSPEAIEKLLLERFETVKKGLDGVTGKLVNMAIFDHAFQGRPERGPLATLTWKDWRGDPEIKIVGRKDKPAATAVATAAATAAATATAAASVSASASASASVSASASASATASKAPSAPPPAVSKSAPAAPKVGSTPPRASASTPPKKSSEDLMSELTALITDLHFLGDPLEGADFVLTLIAEKIPSELITIYFLDPDKRDLVLVRQRGGKHEKLLTRTSEKTGLAQAVIRGGRAVVIADASRDPRAVETRWKAMGVDAKSLVSAPLTYKNKTFGLIEILNPEGAGKYATADGNALTYIAAQLAEVLDTHGVVLEPERITQSAKKAAR